MESLKYRVLTLTDAMSFQVVRLRSLVEHPEAFGASYEEEKSHTLQQVEARIQEKGYTSLTEAGLTQAGPSEASLLEPTKFIFGAFLEDRLVGFAGFYQHSAIKMRHRGSIWGVYVTADLTGRGIARRLIQEIIQRARLVKDLEAIDLSVNVDNSAARHLYVKCGFLSSYIEPRYLKLEGRYFDSEHFTLTL